MGTNLIFDAYPNHLDCGPGLYVFKNYTFALAVFVFKHLPEVLVFPAGCFQVKKLIFDAYS